jgi:type II secretory pathway pseudopilin PulG
MRSDRNRQKLLPASAENVNASRRYEGKSAEAGFTLIETSIALVVMMIAALGAASLFSFSINYNTGASDRLVGLALAQQQLETIRGAQFNSTTTDTILAGGTSQQSDLIRNGKRYKVITTIDDNPATFAIDINAATTLKRIKVTVLPQGFTQGPVLSAAPIILVTQRARTDR